MVIEDDRVEGVYRALCNLIALIGMIDAIVGDNPIVQESWPGRLNDIETWALDQAAEVNSFGEYWDGTALED